MYAMKKETMVVLVLVLLVLILPLFGKLSYEAGFTNGARAYGFAGNKIEFHWETGYPPITIGYTPMFIALPNEPPPIIKGGN